MWFRITQPLKKLKEEIKKMNDNHISQLQIENKQHLLSEIKKKLVSIFNNEEIVNFYISLQQGYKEEQLEKASKDFDFLLLLKENPFNNCVYTFKSVPFSYEVQDEIIVFKYLGKDQDQQFVFNKTIDTFKNKLSYLNQQFEKIILSKNQQTTLTKYNNFVLNLHHVIVFDAICEIIYQYLLDNMLKNNLPEYEENNVFAIKDYQYFDLSEFKQN